MFTRDYMSLFVLIYFLQGYFSFMIQVTFGGLKWIDLSFFYLFFIDFFFNLSFNIELLSKRLLRFYDPDYGFNW